MTTEHKTKRDGWYVYTYGDPVLKCTMVRVTLLKDGVKYISEQLVGDKDYEPSKEPHRDAVKRGQLGVFVQIKGIGIPNGGDG
jgi:hypothetical protein